MIENQVSLTSIMTAYVRAFHSMNDTPKIFDDPLAYQLIPEERRILIEQGFAKALQFDDSGNAVSNPDKMTALRFLLQTMGLPNVVSRSRYTEDNLEQAVKQGIKQYVILGAGLDSFAFRRSDLAGELQVFEVDHPATQAYKRNRLAELGWEVPPNLHFVPIDFSKENVAEALKGFSFDSQTKSFFSWIGVTMYLTRDDVFTTLRSIAEVAPKGSIVVFDYFVPKETAPLSEEIREGLQTIGEPLKTSFDPSTLAKDLAHVGLRLHENVSTADIQKRYFEGAPNSYSAGEHVHFALAMVE